MIGYSGMNKNKINAHQQWRTYHQRRKHYHTEIGEWQIKFLYLSVSLADS